MAARVRWRGTTTQRGLGRDHQADKKRLLAQHRDGDLCWRCGQPMYSWQALDRDHIIDRGTGGTDGPAVLAHASCNRRAGARNGNQRQPRSIAVAQAPPATCKTCGQAYRRAARICEICSTHYHPTYGEQRTCGRACGLQLQRRNGTLGRGARERKHWPSSPVYARDCATCAKPFIGKQSNALYCSPECRRRSTIKQPRPVTGIGSCEHCGQPFEVKASGRTRRWCSGSCSHLAYLQRKAEGLTTSRTW